MTFYQLLYLLAIAINLALGAVVIVANPRRRLNRQFLVFNLTVVAWQVSGWLILHSAREADAEQFMRIASSIVMLIPMQCWMMGLTIRYPEDSFFRQMVRAWLFFAVSLALSVVPWVPSFILSVSFVQNLPNLPPLAEPVYGTPFYLYGIGLVGSALYLVIKWVQALRSLEGIRKTELGFIVLGATSGVLIGNTLGIGVPLLAGTSQYMPIAHSASVLVLNLILAYGIATRRLLDIGTFLRRNVAHAMGVSLLFALFLVSWRFSAWSLSAILKDSPDFLPYAVAALVVAYSSTAVFRFVHRMSGYLFPLTDSTEFQMALRNAQQTLQSVGSLRDLLDKAASILKTATQARRVEIYLSDGSAFSRRHPEESVPDRNPFEPGDPLLLALASQPDPLVLHDLERRPAPLLASAGKRLRQLNAQVAVGIWGQSELRGFLLFDAKSTGRMYKPIELDALQLLCNHLAVSIENAGLYTELQDQSRYLDNLLEHLVSGVIAVNESGLVTVVNHEARRILGRSPESLRGQSFSVLPDPFDAMLAETLMNRHGMRDRDLTLCPGAGPAVPVRAGTSLFYGREGRMLGALLVFHDLTAIKALEDQVRRTDRLAGVGTLAAGMAHEIKNPLVAIKTFAQLLPERYDDPEFRDACSGMMGREVDRIDSLVNQLLRFTRPQKPNLAPIRLHETLRDSLRLVAQPARQKKVRVEMRLEAARDRILGDPNLLTQAFLNFHLNALDAMNGTGVLSVETEESFVWAEERDLWNERIRVPAVSVSIRDTGRGIPPGDLQRVFDPFYTTKAEGTGLGLSVAHGILREHRCHIDVRSEVDRGTTFVLIFPIDLREERPNPA